MYRQFLNTFMNHVKKLDRFSAEVIRQGAKLSLMLFLLAGFFYFLAGKYGDYFAVLSCARGALEAAPAVLTAAFICALISDIAIKDRKQ